MAVHIDVLRLHNRQLRGDTNRVQRDFDRPCRDAGNSFGLKLAQGVERSSPRIERRTPSR